MGKIIAAGVFLINKENKVLVCHPTNQPQTMWSIPKGKVEKDEEMIDAAIRETFEETNIDLTNADSLIMLDMVNYSHKKKAIQGYVLFERENPSIDFDSFELRCNSNVPEDIGGFPEMDDYQWVNFEKARVLLHYTQAESLDIISDIL